MFRRRKQFGLRRKRYRTPFTGSSYLYAADMEYRGRATTLACGPVAVGEIVVTPIEWRNGNQVIHESDAAVPMTYPMIANLLCDQGAPRSLGIAGWATGYVQRIKMDVVSFFRQWCTEFVTRIAPSVLNIIDARGVEDLYALKTVGEGGPRFLTVLNDLKDRLSANIQAYAAGDLIQAARDIWGILNTVTISGPDESAYVHIPFTYLARSKPPRAVQRRGVWVFAKSQLRHELSVKAAEKGVKKYGVRMAASVFNEGFAPMDSIGPPVAVGANLLGHIAPPVAGGA